MNRIRKILVYSIMAGSLLIGFVFASSNLPVNCDNTVAFQKYLNFVRKQALSHNISEVVVSKVLQNARCNPIVIDKFHTQPEYSTTFKAYKSILYKQTYIDKSLEVYMKYQSTFQDIWERYAVEPSILLALWSIETHFGKAQGKFLVVNSLATMGFVDKDRQKFFTAQIISLMKAIQKGYITSNQLYGSWAGAMGHFQFMPTTFLYYAQDGNGDKKIDLWGSPIDSLYSAANYLSAMHWRADGYWGVVIAMPKHVTWSTMVGKNKILKYWISKGIMVQNKNLYGTDTKAMLLMPYQNMSKGVLVFHNYFVLKKWNRSPYFDIVAGMLAQSIRLKIQKYYFTQPNTNSNIDENDNVDS